MKNEDAVNEIVVKKNRIRNLSKKTPKQRDQMSKEFKDDKVEASCHARSMVAKSSR